jgi:CubicO group peptidase (beta-lactamase class C family)
MNTVKPDQVGCSPARLKRIGTAMQRYVDDDKIAGILAMVARRGQVVYSECFGMMDIEANKSMQFDTLFRIYSMTKPITSVAVMMLYEEGHFQLGDPILRFIPGFEDVKVLVKETESGLELANLEREITIWHLLTHTSGLSYGFDENDPVDKMYQKRIWRVLEQKPNTMLEQMIQELAWLPLAHQPGSAWRYSMATDVLGYLVQVVSGMPFGDFLKQRVFEPLGMVDTDFYVPQDKIERFAANYGPGEKGGLKVIDAPATSQFAKPTRHPSGGGGLVSTASDYVRFAQMLLNQGELDGVRLLGRKTIELMTMNHLPDEFHPFEDPSRGFGLGVGVLTDVARSQTLGSVGTYGWGGAANTIFWIDPQEELIGLLMLQFMPNNTYPVVPDFRVLVYQSIVD